MRVTAKQGQLRRVWGSAVVIAVALIVATSARAADLVSYTVVDNERITEALTAEPGDPVRGRAAVIHRQKGNCLACHMLPIPEEQFHGDTGPTLVGVGARYDAGELRLRIVNSKIVNPETMMPAFYRVEGLHRVGAKFKDIPMLSAQEVEDVVAYLLTLTED